MSPRPIVWAALLLLVGSGLVALPAGAEHPDGGDPLGHLNLDVRDLQPGESKVHDLLSEEGPLRTGWIYIMYGAVQGDGHVVVNLTFEGEVVERFVWTGGSYHHNSTKIRHSGMHELVLWNPTNQTLRYAFYYDQSCNCAGKVIPLDGGFVLFNHQFQKGREVDYRLYVYEESFTLRAMLAAHDPDLPTGHWPEDFEILDEQVVSGQEWIEFGFVPNETATYYVFFEAVAGASPETPIRLTPMIEVEEEETAPAPPVWPILFVLALVLARRRV